MEIKSGTLVRIVLGQKMESDVMFHLASEAARMGRNDEALWCLSDALNAREHENQLEMKIRLV